jgi:hypothetical protein
MFFVKQVNTATSSIQDDEVENVIDGGGDENKYMDHIQGNNKQKAVKNGNKEHPVEGMIKQVIIISYLVTY